MSSFPLTFIFFKMVKLHHQPVEFAQKVRCLNANLPSKSCGPDSVLEPLLEIQVVFLQTGVSFVGVKKKHISYQNWIFDWQNKHEHMETLLMTFRYIIYIYYISCCETFRRHTMNWPTQLYSWMSFHFLYVFLLMNLSLSPQRWAIPIWIDVSFNNSFGSPVTSLRNPNSYDLHRN